jgi:hypothetical protein
MGIDMYKVIFNRIKINEFQDKFGNDFNIVVMMIDKLLQNNPNDKELLVIKLSLNRMVESYFQFMQKGEFNGCHKIK